MVPTEAPLYSFNLQDGEQPQAKLIYAPRSSGKSVHQILSSFDDLRRGAGAKTLDAKYSEAQTTHDGPK